MRQSLVVTGLVILLCATALSCSPRPRIDDHSLRQSVMQAIEAVRTHEAPDQRLAVFELTPSVTNGRVTTQGKVMAAQVKQTISQAVAAIKGIAAVDNQVVVLPDPALGAQTYALAKASVVNLGTKPLADTGQDLATQALMAEQLLVLDEQSGWYRVQMWDGYLGWVRAENIVRQTAAEIQRYRSGPQVEIVAKVAPLLTAPGSSSKMAEALQATVLPLLNSSGNYFELALPGGERAWVEQKFTRRYDSSAAVFSQKKGVEAVIATARQFIGLPYLWGGTTAKGFDCSGFTQYALRVNGYRVLRDADQQITQGESVERQDLQRGDLVFFTTYKSTASHMGIYLGDGEYLHSSGKLGVAVSSLDPRAKNYDAELDRKYLGARRVIQ